ncbi:MAG: hypothetical protein FWG18_03195 [Alphaproteobacteria bacterium]|nr:hypothetical protein [Alphaproteobacteria bacterium]
MLKTSLKIITALSISMFIIGAANARLADMELAVEELAHSDGGGGGGGGGGGRCEGLTEAECQAMYTFGNGEYELVKNDQLKWCDNTWSLNYFSDRHIIYNAGSCNKFKCKSGCLESESSKRCLPTDPNGTFGGTYADAATNVCKKCGAEKYVDGNKCSSGVVITREAMAKCWCHKTKDEFKKCLDTGGKCNWSDVDDDDDKS